MVTVQFAIMTGHGGFKNTQSLIRGGGHKMGAVVSILDQLIVLGRCPEYILE